MSADKDKKRKMIMETADWHELVSQPRYKMKKWEKDLRIKARDGTMLYADVCRPDAPGKFPALLSISPYGKDMQHLPAPIGKVSDYTRGTGGHESGVTEYFVPRGYVHVHADYRGISKSGGSYVHFGLKQQEDGYDIVEWIARQPWCDGNVGMLGMSYFATNQYLVAAQQPPHLKAIFPHDGFTDKYRHLAYHGGMLNFGFYHHIWRLFPTSTTRPMSKDEFSPKEYERKCQELRDDYAIQTYPYLYKLTICPEYNPLLLDMLLHPFDGPFYWERSAHTKLDRIKIPTYCLSRWSAWAIHLPGAFDAFGHINAPKKLTITETPWEGGFGRPWYENHDLVLRWYDHWLKGNDTGVMDEPPIRIFVKGTNEWRYEEEWPLKRTQWTKFFLRQGGMLSQVPPEPHERPDSFVNDPWQSPGEKSSCVTFATTPLKEDVEVTGPSALYFFAALSTEDANWFVNLWDIASDGSRTLVTKGWLKASHRELDEKKSRPYQPYHKHLRKLPIKPDEVYEYAIDIRDTSYVFKAGHRIQLLFKGQDSPWEDFFIWYHINNMNETKHSIYHDSRYPSYLLLPVIPK
jgi:hypothetical protein